MSDGTPKDGSPSDDRSTNGPSADGPASDGKFYVTTPIYYVNFKPHIGTSYTTVLTDVACRYRRLKGESARLVTGSDEHSQNIADLAEKAGKPLAPETVEAYREEIRSRYDSEAAAYYATARLWDDGIIEPAQTRTVLSLALEVAANAPIPDSYPGVFRM